MTHNHIKIEKSVLERIRIKRGLTRCCHEIKSGLVVISLLSIKPVENDALNRRCLLLKTFFQFPVIILNTFIPAIIQKQAKWEAVCLFMLDNTGAAFSVIGTFLFGAGAFFHIRTAHGVTFLSCSPALGKAAVARF